MPRPIPDGPAVRYLPIPHFIPPANKSPRAEPTPESAAAAVLGPPKASEIQSATFKSPALHVACAPSDGLPATDYSVGVLLSRLAARDVVRLFTAMARRDIRRDMRVSQRAPLGYSTHSYFTILYPNF